jgi:hypothetical protein
MARTGRRYLGLDGEWMSIEGDDLQFALPVTGGIRYVISGAPIEYLTGSRTFGVEFAEGAAKASFTEEFSLNGGNLKVGLSAPHPDAPVVRDRIGVWEGADYCLYCFKSRGSVDDVLGSFNVISIDEQPEGIICTPTVAESEIERGPWVTQEFPGLGVLIVGKLTATIAAMVPRWSGTPVAGGDLYVDESQTPNGDLTTTLYLVNDTAVAVLQPAPTAAEDEVIARLAGLSVAWAA